MGQFWRNEMRIFRPWPIALSLLLIAIGSAVASPLSDYLKKPTPDFAWKEVSKEALPSGQQIITLDMQSQTWHGIPWRHHLVVVEPSAGARAAHPSHGTGLLFVTGSYDGGVTAQFMTLLVEKTGAPAVVLYDVPNQPLFDNLREDKLIAYTFIKYLETGDDTWPLLFPMTKSALAAMTALEQWSAMRPEGKLQHFVVAGASKRGWTTWLVGASDKRVIGIAPMVYNNLNINAQMPHQIDSWGEYSEMIAPYVTSGLLDRRTSSPGQKLVAMVDPYSLRSNLTLPKLLINGTNDRYWTLDAANFYYDQLPGDKHLLYVPNAGHGLSDLTRVTGGLAGFFNAVAAGRPLPDLQAHTSTTNGGVTLSATSTVSPRSVVAWMASSATGDFRNSHWTSYPITLENGSYSFKTPVPTAGHLAIFAEAGYTKDGVDYDLSSPPVILPPIEHRPH